MRKHAMLAADESYEDDFARYGEVELDEAEDEDFLQVELLEARVQAARLAGA